MTQKCPENPKKQRLKRGKMQNHRETPSKLPKKSPEKTTHRKKHTKCQKAQEKPQKSKRNSKLNIGKRKSEGKRLLKHSQNIRSVQNVLLRT